LIELFYVDDHLTNLVLLPVFLVALFFIIRFIELVDNYGYLPYVTNPTCKKCHVSLTLITVCKHDKSKFIEPLIPSLFTYSGSVILLYVIFPYLKSLPPGEVIGYHDLEDIVIKPCDEQILCVILTFIEHSIKLIMGVFV
jgi:hypothetical protein